MQKFKVKFQNSPIDAPQVNCSESPVLNRDNLSVQGKVRTLNTLNVDPPQYREGPSSRVSATVYILNQRGKPLMPCSPRKSRILLKRGEAHVVKTNPFFVIQLKKSTGEQVQACSLGIDSGSKNVGFSVITSQKEIVNGELTLDQKTSSRLKTRRMYRIHRRNRLWYRQIRFNNRKRPVGWLPPSVQRKFNTHITLINKFRSILPIKTLIIEVGNFDIQKIENPDIEGIQYQQGPLFEHQNMRNFLMARENGKCQLCGEAFSKSNRSHMHHIVKDLKGGTDREKNIALLHEKCHTKLHAEKLFHLLEESKNYRDASFMNTVRGRYKKVLPDCIIVYGYETFVKRNELKLEKTHFNDAFIIAGGTSQVRSVPIFLGHKHRNNRILQTSRKGFKPAIKKKKRYPIQPYDLVTVKNKKYVVKGCHCCGRIVVCENKGKFLELGAKKVEKVFHTKSIYLKEHS